MSGPADFRQMLAIDDSGPILADLPDPRVRATLWRRTLWMLRIKRRPMVAFVEYWSLLRKLSRANNEFYTAAVLGNPLGQMESATEHTGEQVNAV